MKTVKSSRRKLIKYEKMIRSVVLCLVIASAFASPLEQMRSMCNEENDSFACMKYKLMNYLETIIKKDNYKVQLKK